MGGAIFVLWRILVDLSRHSLDKSEGFVIIFMFSAVALLGGLLSGLRTWAQHEHDYKNIEL